MPKTSSATDDIMTVAEFRATRRFHSDLGAMIDGVGVEGVPGWTYLDGLLYIARHPDHLEDDTLGWLMLGNCEYLGTRDAMELKLYRFALDECRDSLLRPADADPENIYDIPGIRQSIEEDRK